MWPRRIKACTRLPSCVCGGLCTYMLACGGDAERAQHCGGGGGRHFIKKKSRHTTDTAGINNEIYQYVSVSSSYSWIVPEEFLAVRLWV